MKRFLVLLVAVSSLLSGCTREESVRSVPGYVEGEWRYLAAPASGWLEEMTVEEGDRLAPGALAFRLDADYQHLQVARARAWQRRAEERREDMKTGARPRELAAIEAELEEARANLRLAEAERRRRLKLVEQGLASPATADQVNQRWEAAKARVHVLEAKLASAQLGARPHLQAAAQAEVEAVAKEREMAQWQAEQRTVWARVGGRVERIFYRPGEYVAAGSPVLALLPPEGVKIRFYIPEPLLARFRIGQTLTVNRDGAPALQARLTFIASEAEYTPPVIFSTESRQKLVFMAEARPLDAAAAQNLHPGQPVDVMLP